MSNKIFSFLLLVVINISFAQINEKPEVLQRTLNKISARHSVMEQDVLFSKESSIQFLDFDLTLTLKEDELANEIRYTLDGSTPSATSLLYTGPLSISNPTDVFNTFAVVVRAAAFSGSERVSAYKSHSYVFYDEDDKYKLPVISLITDNSNFYNSDTGIYVRGVNYTGSNWSGNYFQTGIEWERDIHISYFDENGTQQFEQDAGVRIHGGLQRTAPQKSLRFYARSEYGDSDFDYQLLPQKEKDSYKRFLLRAGTGDWNKTFIKDAVGVDLVDGLDIEKQDYRPVITLLNGKNFGIYWLRDFIGTKHFKDKYDVEEESVTILIGAVGNTASVGTNTEYKNLLSFVENNDLSIQSNYDSVTSQMDIYDYINYYASEIYMNNYDWPSGNLRIWKSTEYDNKWRWVLYDLDAAFNGRGGFGHNLLQQATVDGSGWPNPPGTSVLMSGLLENPSFRDEFITRSAYIAHYNFNSEKVINTIEEIRSSVEPEMSFQIEKWNDPGSLSSMNLNINSSLVNFAPVRNGYVQSHYISKFGLPGLADLTLNADHERGHVLLNDFLIPEDDNTATYYQDVTIRLQAVPKHGYIFDHWEGITTNSDISSIEIKLSEALSLTAVFEVDPTALNLTINEVKSCSDLESETDWIEIKRNNTQSIEANEWFLSDDINELNKWSFSNLGTPTFNENNLLVIILNDEITGFQLSINEEIYLSSSKNNSLSIVDQFKIHPAPCKFTTGIFNGSNQFLNPTPGNPNELYQEVTDSIKGLFINEVLASNDNDIRDETNEYEDWLEIFSDKSNLNINGLYLTDDIKNPFKHEINVTDGSMTDQDYRVFWADEDEGEYHVNFKLSKDGECVYLNQLFLSSFLTVDSLCFTSQTTDVSFGRQGDGNLTLVYFTAPTPYATNDLIDQVNPNIDSDYSLSIYPNPFSENAKIMLTDESQEITNLIVYNSSGETVSVTWEKVLNGIEIQRRNLLDGIYIYQLIGAENNLQQGKMMVVSGE